MNNNIKLKQNWVFILLVGLFCYANIALGQTTADLTPHAPTETPPGSATFEWHNAIPFSTSTVEANASEVDAGIYYGVYNYGSSCYSEPSPIKVIEISCGVTADLTASVESSSISSGSVMTFHSALPASTANTISGTDVTEAGVGTYYVTSYNTSTLCYSAATPLIVIEAADLEIGGTIYLDPDGSDGINGTAADGTTLGLYVSLVDGTTVLATAAVGSDGTYLIENIASGTNTLVLHTTAAGSATAAAPATYYFVAEGGELNASNESSGDGNVDGQTTIIFDCSAITYENNKVAAGASYTSNDFGIFSSILPVDLVSFKGVQVEDAINLTWKVENVSGFSHFEVLKSIDVKEFNSLTKVNESNSNIYNFVDSNPFSGTNYYQLKMVDLDGSSKLSNIISINYETGATFALVENPARNGEFKVKTNSLNPNFIVKNSSGMKLRSSTITNSRSNYTIKVENASSGIYFLNIVSEDGNLISKKVLLP